MNADLACCFACYQTGRHSTARHREHVKHPLGYAKKSWAQSWQTIGRTHPVRGMASAYGIAKPTDTKPQRQHGLLMTNMETHMVQACGPTLCSAESEKLPEDFIVPFGYGH